MEVDKQKLYRAKRMALARLGGDHACAYKNLHKYGYMLGFMNPSTMFKVKCEMPIASNNPAFQRYFVSFSA